MSDILTNEQLQERIKLLKLSGVRTFKDNTMEISFEPARPVRDYAQPLGVIADRYPREAE